MLHRMVKGYPLALKTLAIYAVRPVLEDSAP